MASFPTFCVSWSSLLTDPPPPQVVNGSAASTLTSTLSFWTKIHSSGFVEKMRMKMLKSEAKSRDIGELLRIIGRKSAAFEIFAVLIEIDGLPVSNGQESFQHFFLEEHLLSQEPRKCIHLHERFWLLVHEETILRDTFRIHWSVFADWKKIGFESFPHWQLTRDSIWFRDKERTQQWRQLKLGWASLPGGKIDTKLLQGNCFL